MLIPEAAAEYFLCGWRPIPVSASTKRPLVKWSAQAGQLPCSAEGAQSFFDEKQARHGQVMIGVALPKDYRCSRRRPSAP